MGKHFRKRRPDKSLQPRPRPQPPGELAPWESPGLHNGRHGRRKDRSRLRRIRQSEQARQITTLDSLRQHLGIAPNAWDAIVVSDGSGTSWQREMGYAAVLIRNNSFSRELFYGGNNHGTNNLAEMMAIFWPLFHLANQQAGVAIHGCRVHVVTDSMYVRDGLTTKDPINDPKLTVNRELWLAIHAVRRRGVDVFAHHLHRDTIDLNRLCHDLANLSRRSQIGLTEQTNWDIHQANPASSQ